MVEFSRLTDPEMRSIGNLLYSINRISLPKLGQGKSCKRKREFGTYHQTRPVLTKKNYIDMVTDMDEPEQKYSLVFVNIF